MLTILKLIIECCLSSIAPFYEFMYYCTMLCISVPSFTKPLTDTTIPAEATVILECELDNDNAPVTWMKNGHELKAVMPKYLSETKGKKRRLSIFDTIPEDEGEYTCVVGEEKTAAVLTVEREFVVCLFQFSLYRIALSVYVCYCSSKGPC